MPAETRTCPVCWSEFTASPRGRRLYCSKKCCGTAYERRGGRHRSPAAATPEPISIPRQPALQPAAIRGCPHCGQPVTIVALLTTPQAAQTRLPILPGAQPQSSLPDPV